MESIIFDSVEQLFEEQKKDKIRIELDEGRLKKEIGRLKRYLVDRTKKDYQIITTMQDLGVIVDTKGLSRVEIIRQLEEIVCTYRPSCRTVNRY